MNIGKTTSFSGELSNKRWSTNAVTIMKELRHPYGIKIDDRDGTVYVADFGNDRISTWKSNEQQGSVLASNVRTPSDLVVDKHMNSLLIAERNSRRVVEFSLDGKTNDLTTIIDNIDCCGLAIDRQGTLYVSDVKKNEVRQYRGRNRDGTIVAGGHGKGSSVNQLDGPEYITVDNDGNVYVSDKNNHRVVRWSVGAEDGVVVAGFDGKGSKNTQLSFPSSIHVDPENNLYVADTGNNRVVRWRKDQQTCDIIAGGAGEGNGMHQLRGPIGLSFDVEHNLYTTEYWNSRVQLFSVEQNCS